MGKKNKGDTKTERKKNVLEGIDFTSKELGNSRKICRDSYLNPENIKYSEEQFKKINEAYHVLIDEKERKKYDQFGSEYIPRKAPQWQATNVWTGTWDYIR